MDYNYKRQIESLKSGKLWKDNKHIQDWLEAKWLSFPQVKIIQLHNNQMHYEYIRSMYINNVNLCFSIHVAKG